MTKIENYKGFRIETNPNGNATCSISYNSKNEVAFCSFGIVGKEDSVEKVKIKIDNFLNSAK
jgi:hypothetical protein